MERLKGIGGYLSKPTIVFLVISIYLNLIVDFKFYDNLPITIGIALLIALLDYPIQRYIEKIDRKIYRGFLGFLIALLVLVLARGLMATYSISVRAILYTSITIGLIDILFE